MEPCSFGENAGDCHKTSYVRTIGFKSLADVTEEGKKVLLWRVGKRGCVIDADKLNICYHHHHSKLETIFEKRSTKCCNLFKTHKRNVKRGHKISLQLATTLDDHGYECIPGWQFCRTCYDHAQRIEKNDGNEASQSEHEPQQVNSTTTDYSTSNIDSDEARKQSRDSLNNCLQSIGATPIKTHSMAKHRSVHVM